jgi:hypothetical protein
MTMVLGAKEGWAWEKVMAVGLGAWMRSRTASRPEQVAEGGDRPCEWTSPCKAPNNDQPPAAFASSASVSSAATAASSAFTHPGETPNPESPELLRECDAPALHSVSIPITSSTTKWFDDCLVSPGAEDGQKSQFFRARSSGCQEAVRKVLKPRPTLPTPMDMIDDEQFRRSTPINSCDNSLRGDLGATSLGGTAQETKSVFSVHTSVRRAQDGVLRDSAWTFAFFVVSTLFATAPRWIALLSISWLVPHAPMPAALDDFKSMWTPCKDPKNMFPAFSPDGQLYKSLEVAHNSFEIIGFAIMTMCFCHLWLAVQDWAKGTWARTMFWTALRLHDAIAIASVGFVIASQVALHRMGVGTEDATTRDNVNRTKDGQGRLRPAILEQPDLTVKFWSQVIITASVWVCVLASIARWLLLRESRNESWFQRYQLHIAPRAVAGGVILLFYFSYLQEIGDPASFLYDMHMIWPLLMAKVGTGALRMLLSRNYENLSSHTIEITNFMIFSTDFTMSMYVRVLGQGRSGTNVSLSGLSDWAYSAMISICILTAEAVVFTCQSWALVLRCHEMNFKNINAKTLVDILATWKLYQRHTKLVYSHVLVEEFAEISSCVLIAVYQLSAPVWNQYGTWGAYAHYYDSRIWKVVILVCFRLFMQVTTLISLLTLHPLSRDFRPNPHLCCCDSKRSCEHYGSTCFMQAGASIVFLCMAKQLVPQDHTHNLQNTFKRRVLGLYLGFILFQGLSFWPKVPPNLPPISRTHPPSLPPSPRFHPHASLTPSSFTPVCPSPLTTPPSAPTITHACAHTHARSHNLSLSLSRSLSLALSLWRALNCLCLLLQDLFQSFARSLLLLALSLVLSLLSCICLPLFLSLVLTSLPARLPVRDVRASAGLPCLHRVPQAWECDVGRPRCLQFHELRLDR